MDSKNIHISFRRYLNYINWEMHEESEWIFVGVKEEFNKTETTKILNAFFEESELYLIIDRHNSFLIQKEEAITKVLEFIKEHNPTLVNMDFSKIMEFSKIGVIRLGNRKLEVE
ncbi:calponin homology domain-containing protein [Adhaeribacter radiodurans]|uniref:Uncharacterized protein n=1 Tax=Adhaeribacter radiodurans TaxID=2745197 RepID=A0A7L7L7L9_9BACT|nr:hypothetical protein [Adhaeribacter radiodurans]QMU28800.1 hypothetical protein HUW48_12470 [Adhaeribacter radiodurans]